jgi:hypothetical protein
VSDKDVQRNVRSSGEEGIQTPTEKHYHSLSEKDNVLFGDKAQDSAEKKNLLAKFKDREKKWRERTTEKGERENQATDEKT